ncbi:biphenyl 2,3-dioxygenase [Marinococcus halophilus]|uniref:Blue-light photoreceptor n=1 Tax=Marinococcus halophilus TaxID=1371 RepID=A0A510Y5I1_MARHA|nr:STAS domain-containing protein [Marinococcus halophilus]OZT78954.1 biphenyl 2,3-dioxygenase [Marinococcus halophilus]GEK58602.1 blue-light photoreceptor [Marinococcus halophilus]
MNRDFPLKTPTNSLLLTAVDHTRVGVIITDPDIEDNPIIYTNSGFCNLTGYSAGEVLGSNCRFLQGPESDIHTIERMRESLKLYEPISLEIINYRKDGTKFWNELHIDPVYEPEEDKYYFIGVQKDITKQKNAEQDALEYFNEINLLSTPIVPIIDSVYAMPLIGNVDEQRLKIIFTNITDAIHHSKVETLIVDLSGLSTLNDEIMKGIFTLNDLLKLLGTELIVTGVSPSLAVRSKDMDFDFSAFQTFGTVKDAVRSKQRSN